MKSYLIMLSAIVLGISLGLIDNNFLYAVFETISKIFMNALKLLAAPVVFLSILSTLASLRGVYEMKEMGKRVLKYTLLTTVIAAIVALSVFLIVQPAKAFVIKDQIAYAKEKSSYISFFLNTIPSNFVQAFLENNVVGIAFMAAILGLATLYIPKENKENVGFFFTSLFQVVLKVAEWISICMPLVVFAFTYLLVKELSMNWAHFASIVRYLSVVLIANIIQGCIIIPALLIRKKIAPLQLAKKSFKALALAFFSKSSNATLPVTLEVSQNKLGISSKVANFSLPICTVINMNGCAAFILTTVLFVSQIHGCVFSYGDYFLWVILATIAAVGNAGVPMGCFFLSSTFLIWMGVSLTTMGMILPFYAFLDMCETALNVWSDISVTAIVDKELKQSARKEFGLDNKESKCSA